MTVPHHSEPAREAVAETVARKAGWYPAIGKPGKITRSDKRCQGGVFVDSWEEACKYDRLPFSASPAPAAGGLEAALPSGRDIWEVSNQLAGYVGPNTPHDLAVFLIRESGAAAELARHIIALASPAATSAETQGGDGVREAAAIERQACAYLQFEAPPWASNDYSSGFWEGIATYRRAINFRSALAPSTSAATRGEPVGAEPELWSPKLEAIRLLAAEDKRQLQILDLLETIREQIRLGVKPEHRPEGLMKNMQNAVYALRGRLALLNDAAIMAPLRASPPAPAVESAQVKEDTMFLASDGEPIVTGDIIRAPITINTELHGSWADYTVRKAPGGYLLSYLRSEKGQILPEGYTGGYMHDALPDGCEIDLKTLVFTRAPIRVSEWLRIRASLDLATDAEG